MTGGEYRGESSDRLGMQGVAHGKAYIATDPCVGKDGRRGGDACAASTITLDDEPVRCFEGGV